MLFRIQLLRDCEIRLAIFIPYRGLRKINRVVMLQRIFNGQHRAAFFLPRKCLTFRCNHIFSRYH